MICLVKAISKPIVKGEWSALIIDDASYSGTQARTLLKNVERCGVFEKRPEARSLFWLG
jgi:hypothetical protein